jgi:hypothetical protein
MNHKDTDMDSEVDMNMDMDIDTFTIDPYSLDDLDSRPGTLIFHLSYM